MCVCVCECVSASVCIYAKVQFSITAAVHNFWQRPNLYTAFFRFPHNLSPLCIVYSVGEEKRHVKGKGKGKGGIVNYGFAIKQ